MTVMGRKKAGKRVGPSRFLALDVWSPFQKPPRSARRHMNEQAMVVRAYEYRGGVRTEW